MDRPRPRQPHRRTAVGQREGSDQHREGDEHRAAASRTDQLARQKSRGDHQRQRRGRRRRPPAHAVRGPPVLVGRRALEAADDQVRQHAGAEPAQHPHGPAPRVVRAAGEQVGPGDRGHQRQRPGCEQGDGQVAQPVEHQCRHREQQVGQPLRADRPRRAHPGRAVEERGVPQLDEHELLQVLRKADDGLHRLEGDLVVGAPDQARDHPDPEEVEHHRVRRPDPAGPGPDEPGGRGHLQGGPQPVEVGVGDDEPAEDEEQVHTQRTGRDQRAEHVDGGGDAVEAGEVEVEQHDPGRRDDPQPGQCPELSRARSNLIARAGGAWGGRGRHRHDRRNEGWSLRATGDLRTLPGRQNCARSVAAELRRTSDERRSNPAERRGPR